MNKTQPRSTQQRPLPLQPLPLQPLPLQPLPLQPLPLQSSQAADTTATARSNTMQTLMSGTPGGAPRIDCQLEIFPLQPGSNPAQSEGGPRRPGSSDRHRRARSGSLSPRGDGSTVDSLVETRASNTLASNTLASNTPKLPNFPSLWSVAHQAWAAVDRRRARRRGIAATASSQRCARQQGSASVMQPAALNPREGRHIWSPLVSLIGERQVKDEGMQIDGDRLTRFELVLAAIGVPAAALLFLCVL
ncbi:MAG: hypothetical protein HN940_12665 [Planctomycetes bacterium]|nr:hypothetical protein [Planctomycetota bacterium]